MNQGRDGCRWGRDAHACMYTERPKRLLGAGSVSERGVDKPVGDVSIEGWNDMMSVIL